MALTLAKCDQCPYMQPIPTPSLLPNEANGMLVLDHYYEFFSGCRVVVIRCSADTASHKHNSETYSPVLTLPIGYIRKEHKPGTAIARKLNDLDTLDEIRQCYNNIA